jgi:hypothetical protein
VSQLPKLVSFLFLSSLIFRVRHHHQYHYHRQRATATALARTNGTRRFFFLPFSCHLPWRRGGFRAKDTGIRAGTCMYIMDIYFLGEMIGSLVILLFSFRSFVEIIAELGGVMREAVWV